MEFTKLDRMVLLAFKDILEQELGNGYHKIDFIVIAKKLLTALKQEISIDVFKDVIRKKKK